MSDGTTVLLRDQQRRWAGGERVRVEDYLHDRPALDADALIKLIAHEMILRREAGEALTLSEYQQRFPQVADELPPLFDILPEIVDPGAVATRRGGESAGPAEPPWPRVPGYEVLGPLGRGGMGVVYRARQTALERVVALKVIRSGDAAHPQERERFRAEALAAARVQHENVVQIFEVGEHDGQPFLALELVDGPSLRQRLAGEPQPPRDAAGLVQTLARAIHCAHAHGVVHRDLKPANILLAPGRERSAGASGEAPAERSRLDEAVPKVADFGLAKRLDVPGQTETYAVLGTPSYMAPEQACNSKEVGAPADVYALGAILYECLTGRPPFRGASPLETLDQVRTCEPVPPRVLRPGVPIDLETICLKCLDKEPARRYASAEALADDLRRFRNGEPILARPLRWWGRAAKYARRHPARAGLIVTLAAAGSAVTALGALTWYRGELLGHVRTELNGKQHEVEELDHTAAKAVARMEQAERKTAAARADETRARVARLTHQGFADYAQGRYPQAERVLRELESAPGPRSFEARHLARLCRPELETLSAGPGPFVRSALAPDGTFAVFAGPDGLTVWDRGTGQAPRVSREPAQAFAFSPDGRRLALIVPGPRVVLRDHPFTGAETDLGLPDLPPRQRLPAPYPVLVWAPGGEALAVVADRGGLLVRLRRLPGARWEEFAETASPVRALAFAADGGRLAVGGDDGSVLVLNAATGAREASFAAHPGPVTALAFSPRRGDDALMTGGGDGTARLWDLAAKPPKATREHTGHGGPVGAVTLFPDGTLVTASPDTLRAWDARGRCVALAPHKHPGGVGGLALLAGGTRLATVGTDGAARLWDPEALANPVREPLPPPNGVPGSPCLAFAPDGSALATGNGSDVLLCHASPRRVRALRGHTGAVHAVAFSPDGRRLASAGEDGTVRLWDVAKGEEEAPPRRGHTRAVMALAFAPDGRWLASAGLDGLLLLWRPDGGDKPAAGPHHDARLWAVAFAPDGRSLAVGAGDQGDGAVIVWDLSDGQTMRRRSWQRSGPFAVKALAFAPRPDCPRRLISASGDGTVLVWDDPEQPPTRRLGDQRLSWVRGLALAPDGALATAGADLVLWDVETGEEHFAFPGAGDPFAAAAFSPDGRRLAARGASGLTVWEAVAPR